MKIKHKETDMVINTKSAFQHLIPPNDHIPSVGILIGELAIPEEMPRFCLLSTLAEYQIGK